MGQARNISRRCCTLSRSHLCKVVACDSPPVRWVGVSFVSSNRFLICWIKKSILILSGHEINGNIMGATIAVLWVHHTRNPYWTAPTTYNPRCLLCLQRTLFGAWLKKDIWTFHVPWYTGYMVHNTDPPILLGIGKDAPWIQIIKKCGVGALLNRSSPMVLMYIWNLRRRMGRLYGHVTYIWRTCNGEIWIRKRNG
jgi:hypothetical protein